MPKGGPDKKASDSENPNASSSPEGHTEFLEALRRIVRELQFGTYSPLRPSRECLQRIREGTRPQERTLRRLLKEIWDPFAPKAASNPPLNPNVCPALESFRSRVQGPWNRENFVNWFVAGFEKERGERTKQTRKKRNAAKGNKVKFTQEPTGKRNPGPEVEEILFPVPKEVTDAVDAFVRDSGIEVVDGHAVLAPKFFVQLGPLYRYVQGLQSSAVIPSYFQGAPDIPLDRLYVELSASEDRRPELTEEIEKQGEERNAWSRSDRADTDYFARWARIDKGTRISPQLLLVEAANQPAVVFGDPGTGKSTLTRFLHRSVGQGILVPSKGLGVVALPFRIALREFAARTDPNGGSILHYVVRHQLGIEEPKSVMNWLAFLGRLAENRNPSRLLFLVDGIDEIPLDSDENGAMSQSWEDLAAVASVVFTSRRAGFKPPILHYKPFELVPLSDISIQELIQKWFSTVGRGNAELIQSFTTWVFADSRRHEMAGNPSLLTLLCFLNQNRSKNRFIQARSRAHLYHEAVDKLKRGARRVGGADFSWATLPLESFALSRYLGTGTEQGPAALFRKQAVIDHLEQLALVGELGGRPPESALVAWLEMRLVFQWNVGAWHHFIHQTFLEYFAARALSKMPREEVRRLLELHRFNPFWREVWRFYAGMCADRGEEGLERFRDLARSVVEPEDVFGEVLFQVAPLCAEAGLMDTGAILGYDLRQRLFEISRARHREGMDIADLDPTDAELRLRYQESKTFRDSNLVSRIRAMVELDPAYYFRIARRTLDEFTAKPPNCHFLSDRVRIKMLWALLILNCICHPDALDYHRELLRREASWKRLPEGFPLLGPNLATGRNECLCTTINELNVTWLSLEQQLRVLRYLVCTRSPRAILCIRRIDSAAGSLPSRWPKLHLSFIAAYCELQDPAAVPIAARLARDPSSSPLLMGWVCRRLSRIEAPEVADLFEIWLGKDFLRWENPYYIFLIKKLQKWRNRPVCVEVHQALRDPSTSSDLREALWRLVLAREGKEGLKSLQDRILKLAGQRNLDKFGFYELAVLMSIHVQERNSTLALMESFVETIPKRFESERSHALAKLIYLHVTQAGSARSENWLLQVGIPALRDELNRCLDKDIAIGNQWLENWLNAPQAVLTALADVLLEFWRRMEPSSIMKLSESLGSNLDPRLVEIPLALVDSATGRQLEYWLKLLIRFDPCFLICRRDDPRLRRAIQEAAQRSGLLFFEDRLYSPHLPGFVEYSKA